MIFKLTPIVNCQAITDRKKKQVVINNVCKNSKQVRYDFSLCDLLCVYKTGI